MPEGTPEGEQALGVTATNADGNAVILDLGDGRFALYAHLQPGSIRVREGDAVKRGDVLGLVGNTGNGDAPHLHFHVMGGPSPLASNGVPYGIDAFAVTGRAVSSSDLDDELKKADQPVQIERLPAPAKRSAELPADLAIVAFPRERAATTSGVVRRARPSRLCSAQRRSRRRCASSPPRAAPASRRCCASGIPTRPSICAATPASVPGPGWSCRFPTERGRT